MDMDMFLSHMTILTFNFPFAIDSAKYIFRRII